MTDKIRYVISSIIDNATLDMYHEDRDRAVDALLISPRIVISLLDTNPSTR